MKFRIPPLLVVAAIVALFVVLVCAFALTSPAVPALGSAPAPDIHAPAAAVDVVQAPAPPAPQRSRMGTIGLVAVAGLGVMAALYASTTCNTTGAWETAANWSNGVPTSSLSAIVSATGGIPVLPYNTSAVTAKLVGGGTIGIQPGGLNKLKIVSPTASNAMNFASVDIIENATQSAAVPKGHG